MRIPYPRPSSSDYHWLQYLLFDLPYLSHLDSVFFNLTPRLWASSCRRFEGSYCLHLRGQGSPRTNCLTLKMKAVRSFETSGITLPTTRLHTHKTWMFSCTTVRPFKRARFMGLGLVSVTPCGLVERRAFIKWHGIMF